MKRTHLSLFIALAMMASGAMTFVSCEKDPADQPVNEGKEDPNEEEKKDEEENDKENNEETRTWVGVKAGEDLQAAIDAADPGITVRVEGGATFKGNFKMRVGVNVSGGWKSDFSADGQEMSVLDAEGNGRVLDQNRDFDTLTVVSGFEIRNGGGVETAAGAYIKKGGILENCYIHDNHATKGGGGAQVNEGGIIRNCEISNNVSDNNGGGVYVYGLVENCEITFNSADNNCGGGAQIHGAGQMINCIVAKNTAKNGGGIRVYSNDGLIAGCLVTGNTAYENTKLSGTGIVLNGNCTIVNCTIVSNISTADAETQFGPGLYFGNSSSDSPVKNCVIWGNLHNGDATGRQIKGTRTAIEYCAVAGGDSVDPYVIDLSYTDQADGDRPAPGFVAASSNVFRLTASSVLIDKGNTGYASAIETFTTDLDGESRISGDNIDLGAFEYQK